MLEADELVIDNFAGGGGASEGIKEALGREPDYAVNHNAWALAMHMVNHPRTTHLREDIRQIHPKERFAGRRIGLVWFSPDHSKAKDGRPVRKEIRALVWVMIRYARLKGAMKPRVMIMENVEEIANYGPLGSDGKPDPARRGEYFELLVHHLRHFGFKVEWRYLRASSYGAPTLRNRLYMIARSDGLPIVWPEPTHGPGLLPFRTAAEIIDWSLPCPSIFLTREEVKALGLRIKRPLADATLRRIARGVVKFVLNDPQPYIVDYYGEGAGGLDRTHSTHRPLTTDTAGGQRHALVTPFFVPRYGERPTQEPRVQQAALPLSTIVPTGNGASLVAAFLAKHYGGHEGSGWPIPSAMSAITCRDHHAVVASSLVNLRGSGIRGGHDVRQPLITDTAEGNHIAEVRAFLTKYYSQGGQWQRADESLHTDTVKSRFGLVTVQIQGEPHVLTDIGMRMLSVRERFRGQGFPDHYTIDVSLGGRPITQELQGEMVGNSVSPPVARSLVAANFNIETRERKRSAA